ncbi:hypothetical protein HHI36_001384 [Cryptolaemus montrouzieri]|uniref:Cysteine-rich DPF motif domain-containing protein 1 n=1 Tax=Cryptolaemus montrouzieri TaxID=559131 RepID=A0ABD2P7D8_9CUCU
MDNEMKVECEESLIKIQRKEMSQVKGEKDQVVKYFQCEHCNLKEKYEYFGFEPPFFKKYKLREESYITEDPFLPPKEGEIIILGAHCIRCKKSMCKDIKCSFYFNGTYCIPCAKLSINSFPQSVQDKLNKIVL